MNTEIIIALLTLSAVIVGWLLNQLSSVLRYRHDAKANMKMALYKLLDLYYLIQGSNYERIFGILIARLKIYDPDLNINSDQAIQFKRLFLPLLKRITNDINPQRFEEMKTTYENIVEKIAAIDPIRAYYLSGKVDLISIFDKVEQLFEEINKSSHQENPETISDISAKFLKKEIIDMHLSALNREVIAISSKIGFLMKYRIKKALREIDQRFSSESETKFVEEYLQKYVAQIKKNFEGNIADA